MVEKLLIYTDNGSSSSLFPSASQPAIVTAFTFTEGRMGSVNISATLMYPRCLDNEWTQKEYVEFRGEKYWILDTPTSSKSNTDLRYKHELVFKADRTKLDNTYFFDVVSPDATDVDQFVSNSTKFTFFGDIVEFVKRLNYSLKYSGVGYSVVIDEGISSEAKLMSFEDKYFSEVLQEVFNTYELPYYFVGKTIHIGFTNNAITKTFKYGHDRELLTISKTNANYKVVNRCTGIGSTENIPYYYPNDTRKTEVDVEASPDNKNIKTEDITIVSEEKFKKQVSINEEISYSEVDYTDKAAFDYQAMDVKLYMDNGKQFPYTEKNTVHMAVTSTNNAGERFWDGYIYLYLSVKKAGKFWFSYNASQTRAHKNPDAEKPYTWRPNDVIISFQEVGGKSVPFTYRGSNFELDLGNLTEKEYLLTFQFHYRRKEYIDYTQVWFSFYDTHWRYFGYNWNHRDEVISLDRIGISIDKAPAIGDKFKQIKVEKKYMITSPNLLPPIYRETMGAERFYNAKNETYINPDTGDYYNFENEYTEGNPKEMIVSFDYIKPTIKGIKNAAGQLIGEIAAVAFDDDDNDEIDPNTNKLEHPYFYIKLRKFDGSYGFNLFEHAIVGNDGTFSITSGNCAACNFVLSILEKTIDGNQVFYNPVQVDSNGNIVAGNEEDKWNEANIQPEQQDTVNNEVWVRVAKDQDTFGTVMPSNTRNYKPKAGDSFVITNINLPLAYIRNAENELKEAIIKYMVANNSEKFNFSINFKRTFFAEYPEMMDEIDVNARLQIEYNEGLYELYVSQYTYKVNGTDPLPEITVELADTITIRKGNVQKSIDAVKQDIMSSIGSIDFLKMGLKYFIRKDVDDYAIGHIVFRDGIFVTGGVEGNMADVLREEYGVDYIQEDYSGDYIQEDFASPIVEKLTTLGSLDNVNEIVDEVASEDVILVKKQGTTEWTQERRSVSEGVQEAPNDGTLYGRKNRAWEKVPDTPTKLPNPNSLKFTGAVTAEYDGSSAVTVNIPSGGGGSITVDDHLDLTSKNPVQNKVVTMNINEIMNEVFKLSFGIFNGGGTFEKGEIITPYIFWTIMRKGEEVQPTAATVNGSTEGVDANLRKYSSPTRITTNKSYEVVCTYESQTVSKTANYVFSLKKYWGTSASTSLTNQEVLALSSTWASRTMGKTSFDCTGGKYIYYIIPADVYGSGVEFWVNGFKNTDITVTDFTVTNSWGVSASYKVMRLNNKQTGILEVEFK